MQSLRLRSNMMLLYVIILLSTEVREVKEGKGKGGGGKEGGDGCCGEMTQANPKLD